MKKRSLLFALILAMTAFTAHAQIYQMYSQGFETGENANYTVTGNASAQATIQAGGSRALKMTHTSGSAVTVTLDTIDFSANATFSYYSLEFMHIAFVNPMQFQDRYENCVIDVMRPGQTQWTRLSSTHYNMTDCGSAEFTTLNTFNSRTYADWEGAASATNALWKRERFDLEQLFQGVAVTDKKLIIRFTLTARGGTATPGAWYLDDIKVTASSQPMVRPVIRMVSFPDYIKYPSSRGAKVVADITTTVPQGINPDSVYVEYTVGNGTAIHRATLNRTSSTSDRYTGRIPFYGYDTLIHYHLVARDATSNNNACYYPQSESGRMTYSCVRGRDNVAQPTGNQTNVQTFPFPAYGDNRSECVYDSAMLSSIGYGPGAITNFQYMINTQPQTTNRPHLQIRMANVPSTYTRTDGVGFTNTDMQLVYDGAFSITQAAAGSLKNIALQDTFFYGGGDIIVQFVYDGSTDPAATQIKHIPVATNKNSLWYDGITAALGSDAFTDPNFDIGMPAYTRPWFQFHEHANVPLIYDCGISGMSYPSYTTACNTGADSVVVWLKNYGVSVMNAVRIGYKVDNGTPSYYNWTGTLAAGDSVRVRVSTNQNFTIGYHTITAWVDDSITVGSVLFRDHEPYNDTTSTPFVACSGAYSGTRTVGPSGNFATLDQCLYALSRCGVNGPLTIKLPAGVYDVTKFPYIPGTSTMNYVQFEPSSTSANVTFRRSRQGVAATVPALVDLTAAQYIRFKNITFANGRYADNRVDVLAQLGANSHNVQFLNCTFADSNTAANAAQALIQSGDASSLLVANCSFYGGVVGVDVSGAAPDIRASNNTVRNSMFASQVNTAVSIVNQSTVTVDSNYMNDVATNASYVILAQHCYDNSRITRNRVFSSHGASCIGASDMYGTSSQYSYVANNMLVCLDDGSTNMLTTPLNIIKGAYLKVVFNSVRMSAPSRYNIAAATFGGGQLSNSYFQNNVVACFDSSNYAFSFMPGNNTATLHVDHNCYYSVSGVLNKLTGVNYLNLNTWNNAVACESGSVSGNPSFTNGSLVDLRSFSSMLRNAGVAGTGITVDIEGSPRNAAAPSMGAYEVNALAVDFEPVGFVTPFESYCGAPASIPVEVIIRNTGNGTYTYSSAHPATVYYSIDGAAAQSFTMNRSVGPLDTVHFRSTRTMSLPSNGTQDRTYNITMWIKCNSDPDEMNDTVSCQVVSRYAPSAPTVINQNVTYATAATITPTAGVDNWPVSYYTSGNGRTQRSGISWYRTATDDTMFYYGPSLTTTPIFADTSFYISQKRNLPLVKITEVQVNRTAAGATNPMPSWMNTATAFAIELTNVGDYPANIEGDSIIVVQPTAAAKIWVLPNVTIQPGKSLVLQYKTNTTPSDSSRTIYAPSTAIVSVSSTSHFGVIYRDGNGVADAVAFNNVITASSSQAIRWGNQNIPAAVWQGSSIDLAKNGNATNTPTAGARRTAWPTNAATATPTPTASLWSVATAANPMHIGETEPNLVRYYDNGCQSPLAAVNLQVIGIPTTDVSVDQIIVDTGCNLSNAESVRVLLHNYGTQATAPVTIKYSLNGGATVACSNTIASGIPATSSYTHTFTTPLNMKAGQDTVFNILVWVDAVSTDGLTRRSNDTLSESFLSRYSPETPNVATPQSVAYGQSLTLSSPNTVAGKSSIIWYDARHNVMDTAESIVTPNIYHVDTFYAAAVGYRNVPSTHIGTLANETAVTAYPSPYNPNKRYVKEQYIYTAAQIQAAGHGAGTIGSLAFYLSEVPADPGEFTYSYYNIKMGTTTLSAFANTTFATTPTTLVYSANNLTLTAANVGWVEHKLDTPYQWDGTSNILIEVTRALSTAGIATGAKTKFTAQTNTVISKQDVNADQATATTGARGNNRPDLLIGFHEMRGCVSPEETIYVNVTGVPAVDASLEWPASLDTATIASCSTTSLQVNLKNMGNTPLTNYTLHYKVDNGSWSQTTGNANGLALGYSATVNLLSQHLTPGRHTVTAVVRVTGDTTTTNDTIVRTFNVRFCAGTYTIGSAAGRDYATLTVALDTLHNAGVAGPVVFELDAQTFAEQINLPEIPGTSRTNTVTFRTAATAAGQAKIMFAPTAANNYVLSVTGAQYVTFENVYFYGNYTTGAANTIYANVIKVSESDHLTFSNCTIRSKKSAASSTNANLVIIGDNVNYLTIDHCVLDSGYYAIRTQNTVNSHSYTITNNDITGFWYMGVSLRNIDSVMIQHDSIASGVAIANKPLSGIYVANSRSLSIQKNQIYLVDNFSGGKRGIQLYNCRGTSMDRVTIYNNMVSLYGTGVQGLTSYAIHIDSTSRNLSVLYNSCDVYAGANAAATRAFSIQNSAQTDVLNNIFSNNSQGYAAYITVDTNVNTCNYNVYYSNATPNPNNGARKFVHWGTSDCPTIDSLRVINHKDANSLDERPYFYSTTCLKLTLGQFSGLAQYNSDVPLDLYDSIRPQIPMPTIGAHEFARLMHNITVAEIVDPTMPTNINTVVNNIETDSIMVRVKFYNNGSAAENNVTWYAYLADQPASSQVQSVTRTIARLPLRTLYEDSVMLPSPLGVVDTQKCVVVLSLNNAVDANPSDNVDTAVFFIHPAYDLRVTSVAITNNTPAGCRLFQVPITYTIKNEGKKDFPAHANFDLGYYAYVGTPATVSIPTLPATDAELVSFNDPLPVGTSTTLTISPAHQPNLYPTGYLGDITVKLRGWVNYQYDPKQTNDTSAWINVQSNHTPEAPIGRDTTIDYGTWTELYASQAASRPIRWHRDTLGTGFFYNGNNNYSRSTCWSTTPQYFHDSVYYLSCVSNGKNCTSYYSAIHVSVNPPIQHDLSIGEVISPRSSGRVYLENDTVKLRIVNYGSQAASNFSVTYKYMNAAGTTTLATVTETCNASIPGRVGDNISHYDFVFDSLLPINSPVNAGNYSLMAWVTLSNDEMRLNDTLRTRHTFKALPESTYSNASNPTPSEVAGFDITRVAYNTLDNLMPDMIGYNRLTLGTYNNSEVPCLHVMRGTSDTLFIEVANNQNENDKTTGASLFVAIDFNRDGIYDWQGTQGENLTKTDVNIGAKVHSRQTYKLPFTIPATSEFGYMRMLVQVDGDSTTYMGGIAPDTYVNGQAQEYILYIDKPETLPEVDAALTRVSYPRNHIVDTSVHKIGIMLANKGRTALSAARIQYSLGNPNGNKTGSINWTGNLEPGKSTLVVIDSLNFKEGTTTFIAIVNADGDSESLNNSLTYQYHRNYVVTLRMLDDFDVDNKWYAPVGYNDYTRNYWELGTPSKTNLTAANTEPNAWVTNLTQSIATGKRGNRSLLYSPIIDISQIHPDTLSLLLSKNMANNSHLKLQYYNYMDEWVDVAWDSRDQSAETVWYDDDDGWTGNSPSFAYQYYDIALRTISGDFPQNLQFRFVYTTPTTTSASSTFGDGVAIDNFHVDRAQRAVDVGVRAILEPEHPKYGQTIYPKVRIWNYGSGDFSNFEVGYIPYGRNLPLLAVCTDVVPANGGHVDFTFPNPFVVTNIFPDTFNICAFTIAGTDYYKDNDTVCQDFVLSPLDDDLQMYSIVSPGDRCVAGDSITVTVRLRNFGTSAIDGATVTMVFNDGSPITESVNFQQLQGAPLAAGESFNYSFQRRLRATMGTMNLKCYCHYSRDEYIYNDTLSKSISGISAITDVQATAAVLDDRRYEYNRIGIVLDNVGARMANNFKVGYWYDNDTTTRFEEYFYREGGLVSGGHAVHLFSRHLPKRSAPYDCITAYLYIPDDNLSSNDTCTNITTLFSDIQVNKVQVEENANANCRVRMELVNIGTITYIVSDSSIYTYRITATINGNTINTEIGDIDLEPGVVRHLMFNGTVPKSPTRTYVGTGAVKNLQDNNKDNNQTSVVEVINYFEGIPTAETGEFVLEQNYPNPVDGTTHIEFYLPYAGKVNFFVADGLGRRVYQQSGQYSEGRQSLTFDAQRLGSGVYFYGVEFDGKRLMRKMIVR